MFTSNPSTWTAPNCSTPEERGTARLMYDQGSTIPEIAQHLGRATSTIYEWITGKTKQCDDYKVKEWKGKATEDEKQQAVVLYQQHQSIGTVCQLLDRSYDTVRRWLKEAGVDTSGKPKQVNELEQLRAQLAALKLENEQLKNTIIKIAGNL